MAVYQVNEAGFNQKQVDWLDNIFKENLDSKATAEDLYRNQGVRLVVAKIRSEVAISKEHNLRSN